MSNNSMSNKRMEVWIWVCIYAGLLLMSLGLFVVRAQAASGWLLGTLGGLLVLAGVVLVVLRSRREPLKE